MISKKVENIDSIEAVSSIDTVGESSHNHLWIHEDDRRKQEERDALRISELQKEISVLSENEIESGKLASMVADLFRVLEKMMDMETEFMIYTPSTVTPEQKMALKVLEKMKVVYNYDTEMIHTLANFYTKEEDDKDLYQKGVLAYAIRIMYEGLESISKLQRVFGFRMAHTSSKESELAEFYLNLVTHLHMRGGRVFMSPLPDGYRMADFGYVHTIETPEME